MDKKPHTARGPVYVCPRCGHMTDHSWPDIDAITNNRYTEKYKSYVTDKPGKEPIKAKQRWDMIMRHAENAKSLLDFGCGPFALKAFQPENHGVTKLVGFDVNWKTGYYDERVLDDEYDVLCAFHVIEHLIDPWRLLRRVKHKYLAFIIPWIEHVSDDRWANWGHFWSGVHHQFFTRKSLDIYLKDYDVLEENFEDGELDNPTWPEVHVTRMCKRKS